jgi:hypothetical protein
MFMAGKTPATFPKKDDPRVAELVGILLGDGSIGVYHCKRKNGGQSEQCKVQITCNSKDDREYIEYMEKLIFELFGEHPKISYRDTYTCDLRLFRREILEFLVNEIGMELSPKRNRAKIPQYYLENDFELDVLRGYFDTDGSLVIANNNGTTYPRLEMKVCPSPMQKQFCDILERNGFKFGFYQIGNGEVRIQMNGKKPLAKWLNKVGFSNPKHARKVKRIAGDGFEPSTFGL